MLMQRAAHEAIGCTTLVISIDLNALLRAHTKAAAKRLDCRPVCVCWERALSERLAPLLAAVISC